MTKERFSEILKECGFTDYQINILWNTRPPENLDERKLRETAKQFVLYKDLLIQA